MSIPNLVCNKVLLILKYDVSYKSACGIGVTLFRNLVLVG